MPLHGIIAALPTPITPQGQLAQDLFVEHGRWTLANGCHGLNILGTTGEANSLPLFERQNIMRIAAKELDSQKLMVGTTTPSLDETLNLTSLADTLGYQVALVLPPYYYKPLSEDDLFAWYAALHDGLGSRKISIYFYNFPQLSGIPLPLGVVTRLHRAYPDRFTGIKDSSGDLEYASQLAKTLCDCAVFPSSETTLKQATKNGYAGCISATVNITARLCAQVWDHTADQAIVERIKSLRESLTSIPPIAAIKYMISKRTGDPRWQALLPPLRRLSDSQTAMLDGLDDTP
ncbi:MAG: dihydrodipicolinate synthase family protein [Pseudomonadota bacterium]